MIEGRSLGVSIRWASTTLQKGSDISQEQERLEFAKRERALQVDTGSRVLTPPRLSCSLVAELAYSRQARPYLEKTDPKQHPLANTNPCMCTEDSWLEDRKQQSFGNLSVEVLGCLNFRFSTLQQSFIESHSSEPTRRFCRSPEHFVSNFQIISTVIILLESPATLDPCAANIEPTRI